MPYIRQSFENKETKKDFPFGEQVEQIFEDPLTYQLDIALKLLRIFISEEESDPNFCCVKVLHFNFQNVLEKSELIDIDISYPADCSLFTIEKLVPTRPVALGVPNNIVLYSLSKLKNYFDRMSPNSEQNMNTEENLIPPGKVYSILRSLLHLAVRRSIDIPMRLHNSQLNIGFYYAFPFDPLNPVEILRIYLYLILY